MSITKNYQLKTKNFRVYMDHAATTPLDFEVEKEMLKVEREVWGNPSSIHKEGVKAKKVLDESRKKVASFFSCKPSEIIFTSGGTESNNLAIFGIINAISKSKYRQHIITTNIEHPSVLEPIKELVRRGVADATFVAVEKNGIVDPEKIIKAIKSETVLISVQLANNEIGTIQPISKISKSIRMKNCKAIFHTDASQAPLYLSIQPETLGVDLITVDAHKIYGPKGIGALFVKRGTNIKPILFGGKQESGLRSTTENLPAIVGLAKALEIALEKKESESKRLTELRDYFFQKITNEIPFVVINGDEQIRLPNNVNISIPEIDAEYKVLCLDDAGIACSTKSSCIKEGGSYVIGALGGKKERAKGSIRFTFGRQTSKEDVDYLIDNLKRIIN